MINRNEEQNFNKLSEVINEYNRLHIAQQLDYDKFYLYSIITHSTAIEGSTITEIENQLLFDEGISANKPIHEQLMNLDLKAAYEKSFEFGNPLRTFSSRNEKYRHCIQYNRRNIFFCKRRTQIGKCQCRTRRKKLYGVAEASAKTGRIL